MPRSCCCCCRNDDTFVLGGDDEERILKKQIKSLNAADDEMPVADRYEGLVDKVKEMYNRPHSFENFYRWRIISKQFLYDCDVCEKLMSIWMWTAKSRCITCHQVLHPKCQNKLRLPCIPKPEKHKYPRHWFRIKVAERFQGQEGDGKDDFKNMTETERLEEASPEYADFFRRLTLPMLSHDHLRPKIPHVLIHCVRGLDAFHSHRENLYTDSAEDIEIGYDTLLKLTVFRQLQRAEDNYEPYQLTSVIKIVLFGLKEALIPFTFQSGFLKALECKEGRNQQEKIRVALTIMKNKHANDERLTLVFMMLHWQRILSKSDANKSTVERLAPAIAHFVIRHLDCIEVTTMLLRATPSMWESMFDFPMKLEGNANNV